MPPWSCAPSRWESQCVGTRLPLSLPSQELCQWDVKWCRMVCDRVFIESLSNLHSVQLHVHFLVISIHVNGKISNVVLTVKYNSLFRKRLLCTLEAHVWWPVMCIRTSKVSSPGMLLWLGGKVPPQVLWTQNLTPRWVVKKIIYLE